MGFIVVYKLSSAYSDNVSAKWGFRPASRTIKQTINRFKLNATAKSIYCIIMRLIALFIQFFVYFAYTSAL